MKSKKLIDGRKGNYFLSETASAQVGEMVEYVQNKAFNKKYYIDLSYELIKKQNAKGTTRKEIDSLIIPKLSKILNDDQKRNFVRNMLHQMVVEEMIVSKERRYYLKT